MELAKLIYDVKEGVSAISDDRFLDERYITHLINTSRADLVRKMLDKRPGYNTLGMEQNVDVTVASASRSIFGGLTLDCNVLRSTTPLPKLIYEGSLSNYFKVRTADLLNNTIEIIDISRANSIVFEFPVVYAVLDFEYYLYFLVPNNNQELKYAVLTGVFEDPLEVDPELTDYPLNQSEWASMKPRIVADILNRPSEDPLNNSEADYGEKRKAQ
jgi:hypothetical protein